MSRPTSTAGTGRRSGKDTGDEARFYCTTCGFPVNKKRDGIGGEATRTQTQEHSGTNEASYSETVSGGCPGCGSRAWNKGVKLR